MSGTDDPTPLGHDSASLVGPESVLWKQLRVSSDAAVRKQLIEMHAGLAKRSASSLLNRLPGLGLDIKDFTQTAITGLIEAVDRFDPTAGVTFASYARKRIRGALLNELPKETELMSQLSFRRRMLRERAADLSGASDDVFLEMVDIAVGLAVGFMLEDSAMYAAANAEAKTPERFAEKGGEMRLLASDMKLLLKHLSYQQQIVIEGHYLDEKPFKQIAEELKVSKARVSQLHQAGLRELRNLFRQRHHLDVVA